MPKELTLLGFDFGMKRIGVALGQTLLNQARPLKTLTAKQGIPDWTIIDKLIADWGVQMLVVGIPTHLDDSEQFTTVAAKTFAQQLAERTKLPVHQVDERLTTVDARQQVFDQGGYKALKKSEIDSLAAKLILEQWLRTHKEQ